jgi:hypothetical protein
MDDFLLYLFLRSSYVASGYQLVSVFLSYEVFSVIYTFSVSIAVILLLLSPFFGITVIFLCIWNTWYKDPTRFIDIMIIAFLGIIGAMYLTASITLRGGGFPPQLEDIIRIKA